MRCSVRLDDPIHESHLSKLCNHFPVNRVCDFTWQMAYAKGQKTGRSCRAVAAGPMDLSALHMVLVIIFAICHLPFAICNSLQVRSFEP
jgi:hypothetical protein